MKSSFVSCCCCYSNWACKSRPHGVKFLLPAWLSLPCKHFFAHLRTSFITYVSAGDPLYEEIGGARSSYVAGTHNCMIMTSTGCKKQRLGHDDWNFRPPCMMEVPTLSSCTVCHFYHFCMDPLKMTFLHQNMSFFCQNNVVKIRHDQKCHPLPASNGPFSGKCHTVACSVESEKNNCKK